MDLIKTPALDDGKHRVRLLGCGPLVSHDTNKLLCFWRDVHGVPIGRAIDAMASFVKEKQDFRIPKNGVRVSLKKRITESVVEHQLGKVPEESSITG